MSENATYEANTVEELQAEVDRREGLSRSGVTHKADLIALLEKDDRAAKRAGADKVDQSPSPDPSPEPVGAGDIVPTKAGDPERITGDEVAEYERADVRGNALGDIPLLDPAATVGTAPKIPEGFESAAASARGSRADVLADTLGRHGIEDVQAAMDRRQEMADAAGGEVLLEASGPVAVKTDEDDDT